MANDEGKREKRIMNIWLGHPLRENKGFRMMKEKERKEVQNEDVSR